MPENRPDANGDVFPSMYQIITRSELLEQENLQYIHTDNDFFGRQYITVPAFNERDEASIPWSELRTPRFNAVERAISREDIRLTIEKLKEITKPKQLSFDLWGEGNDKKEATK